MKLTGAHSIPLPPEKVFAALTDPVMLQRAIPGCEKLTRTGPDEYAAELKIGVASIKGNYKGRVRLTDQEPPGKFTMHLEGKGGPGFVKGVSRVELTPEHGGTRLTYAAEVQVGGLIAAVGSRVVEAASKKLSADFFTGFEKVLRESV